MLLTVLWEVQIDKTRTPFESETAAPILPHWPNWLEVLALEARGSPFESEVGHQIKC